MKICFKKISSSPPKKRKECNQLRINITETLSDKAFCGSSESEWLAAIDPSVRTERTTPFHLFWQTVSVALNFEVAAASFSLVQRYGATIVQVPIFAAEAIASPYLGATAPAWADANMARPRIALLPWRSLRHASGFSPQACGTAF